MIELIAAFALQAPTDPANDAQDRFTNCAWRSARTLSLSGESASDVASGSVGLCIRERGARDAALEATMLEAWRDVTRAHNEAQSIATDIDTRIIETLTGEVIRWRSQRPPPSSAPRP